MYVCVCVCVCWTSSVITNIEKWRSRHVPLEAPLQFVYGGKWGLSGRCLSLFLVWKLCICGVISDKEHEEDDRVTPPVSSVTLRLCDLTESKSPDGRVTSVLRGMYTPSPWGLWECQDCQVFLPSTPHSGSLYLDWRPWPTQAMWKDRSRPVSDGKTSFRLEIRKKWGWHTHKTQADLKLLMWMNPTAS